MFVPSSHARGCAGLSCFGIVWFASGPLRRNNGGVWTLPYKARRRHAARAGNELAALLMAIPHLFLVPSVFIQLFPVFHPFEQAATPVGRSANTSLGEAYFS